MPPVSEVVVDASAVLAPLNQERGADLVAEAIAQGAAICTVNLSEVVGKLAEAGMPEFAVRTAIDDLDLEAVDFGLELAYQAGLLRPQTRSFGLSLGDRACLALAQKRGVPVLTADRTWERLAIGARIQVIR